MTKGIHIKEVLTNENPTAKLYDHMDDALIGICRSDVTDSKGIYSYIKFVEVLVNQGYSEEQAVNYCDDLVAVNGPLIVDDTGV